MAESDGTNVIKPRGDGVFGQSIRGPQRGPCEGSTGSFCYFNALDSNLVGGSTIGRKVEKVEKVEKVSLCFFRGESGALTCRVWVAC